ncbi:toprim domain-containing protein [Mucilaginibacter sp. SMC90]|uniref:toprim domain-containing protein n=1 Tax=Mucilaginibacter sp. SMC90 TaxID=2929803 RepID=UPI001FB3AB52|nr:toprim domain-containing protein [Mucilaginibacter sp. SMC90]UOE51307.1 toprim domain-containing protein [Mucilaginibacter sp. SMC90]
MENNRQRYSFEDARKLDLVDYLSTIGFEPQKITGNNYWYYSPFREEKSPSFKVDRRLNLWHDFGEGKGGNLIDFGIRYHKCSVAEFMAKLNGNVSFLQIPQKERNIILEEAPKIIVTEVRQLRHYALLQYLESRKIPVDIAGKFCREATYTNGGKEYFAIAFKNDAGGYELRNKYFKNGSSPKAVTHIKNGHSAIAVFEGFFDFLSFQTLFKNTDKINSDFLILNSLSFFEKSMPLMESYKEIRLYLDNNAAGQKFTAAACKLSEAYRSESGLYKSHEDLNDFLCKKPMAQVTVQQRKKGIKPS